MQNVLSDTPFSQTLRFLSRKKLFRYAEERPDFVVPPQYDLEMKGDKKLRASFATDDPKGVLDIEGVAMTRTKSKHYTLPYSNDRFETEVQLALEHTKSASIIPQTTSDGLILVDWYTTDDPANPQNWSRTRKAFVVFLICAYTWVVYTGSSIYTPSEGAVMERFGVTPTSASLPLALYVLAYGVGPLLFAPLCEIPIIGRNPVYILTFLLFFVLSFPTAVSNSFGGLLALRFLQGYFGSPALANGGATFSDMYALLYVPYQLSWWVFSAWGGPALGPLMAGFAVSAENWRWSLWEIVWMGAPLLVLVLLFMPETSTANILLRRAKRLRKLTGDSRLQSQSEIDQRSLTASGILVQALIKPIEITLKDPAILFVNVYTALFYGIYYTFFEVFPRIFPPIYGFNLGEIGLAFLSCQVGATLGVAIYFSYLHWYMIPDNLKNGLREQEHRLVPAIFGSVLIPVGLFIFAWTARPSIHWIVPIIVSTLSLIHNQDLAIPHDRIAELWASGMLTFEQGVVIFVVGTFLVLQSIFVYIPLSYPKYAASLFAGNDLFRSSMACGSILYARPLFIKLGYAKGVTVLGGLSVAGILGMIGIYSFGKRLRARSKFAQS